MKELQQHFITNKQTRRVLNLLGAFEHFPSTNMVNIEMFSGSSKRTTLHDIEYVKNYFGNSIKIETKKNSYIFSIVDQKQYVDLKKDLLDGEILFIILESIFQSLKLPILEWSERLHISESSLTRYISKIQPLLDDYELSFKSSPLTLVGDEMNIRKFFMDFYYESDITPHTISPSPEITDAAIQLAESDFIKNYICISFEELSYILYITSIRSWNGNFVKVKSIEFMRSNEQVEEFSDYIKTVFQSLHLKEINENERENLIYILLSRRLSLEYERELSFQSLFYKSDQIVLIVEKFIEFIQPPKDSLAITETFLKSFFLSTYLKHTLSPVLHRNLADFNQLVEHLLSDEYKKINTFVKSTLSSNLQLTDLHVADISANLTLFTDTLRLIYWNKRRNILFLLEGNQFVCNSIRALANKFIGTDHNLFFPNATYFDEVYLENNDIDIIVTNSSNYLSNINDKEFVLFNAKPSADNWNRLIKILNPSYSKVFLVKNPYQ
ncbi:helix-turn-helix domain-containing protein [Enterococcus casseliflavus]|uniref:helix-turn-helix domain-containing protein n=1 Tax=Enterococcus casseliflavus TaxID=37734 RepID=UPI00232CFC5B|nr:helix-turn-helix domain-containing protein [Enterococcus casseliflavus]MDB1689572.1 helix-turn-helix domain-containing protein [Enterococcus casseliflavus]